jgi:hypothetical protein
LLVGLGVPATLYGEALRARAGLLKELLRDAFSQCDVLHVPVLRRPVPTAAETDVGGGAAMQQVLGQIVANTRPFNFLGLPGLCATVCRKRCSLSGDRSARIYCFASARRTKGRRGHLRGRSSRPTPLPAPLVPAKAGTQRSHRSIRDVQLDSRLRGNERKTAFKNLAAPARRGPRVARGRL